MPPCARAWFEAGAICARLHVSPQDIVAKVGIHRAALEASADALHLFLLGQQKSLDFNLAPPTFTSGFTRHLVSRGIYAGSIGLGDTGYGLVRLESLSKPPA